MPFLQLTPKQLRGVRPSCIFYGMHSSADQQTLQAAVHTDRVYAWARAWAYAVWPTGSLQA